MSNKHEASEAFSSLVAQSWTWAAKGLIKNEEKNCPKNQFLRYWFDFYAYF